MPALPDVPNTLRVDLQFTIGEDTDIITRLHLKYTGAAPDVSGALAIAGDVKTAWDASLKAMVFTGNVLESIRITDLTSSSGADATLVTADAGSRSGSFIPAGCCTLANYGISRRYRGGKPRSYWPCGVQGDLVDGQKWGSSYLTAFESALVTFMTDIALITSGSTTITGVYNVSYYHGFTVVTSPTTGRSRNVPTLRTTPLTDLIQTFSVAPKVAYQRRRSVR